MRRNKFTFIAGAAVAVALLIGLGLSTWLFLRERASSRREARLRAEAEDRAKITQAVMFVSQGKFEEADGVLNQVSNFPADPTLDCASAFRSVGEWLALQGRWQLASERYAALIKVNQLSGAGQIIFDYQACGVVLAASGDGAGYGRFWQLAVTNFDSMPNGSILLACLLLPVDKTQIERLKPMAAATEKQVHAIPKSRQSEWNLMPIGLWQYRCGNDDAAIQWCQRAQAQGQRFPPCDAVVDATLAMAYYHQGQTGEACAELAQARQLIDVKFKSGLDRGRPGYGFWFDWVYARQVVQEAGALVNCDGATPGSD